MTFRLVGDDAIQAMQAMAENSVDAIVTDPPYGIRFMGKAWDGADIEKQMNRASLFKRPITSATRPKGGAFPQGSGATKAGEYDLSPKGNRAFQQWTEAWAREALRVLKPGGHLLSSCSTRTYHRMTAGIEDAGFEIRDCLAWMYGSGFPKSLDVSKAIDKAAGAEREVTGRRWESRKGGGMQRSILNDDNWTPPEITDGITAPATPEAQHWNGWGTALKPAFEPIVLARKPLAERNVAANVQRWGTGALNIDGCRIEHDGRGVWGNHGQNPENHVTEPGSNGTTMGKGWNDPGSERNPAGRWPANVTLDETAAAMLDEQTGELTSAKRGPNCGQNGGNKTGNGIYSDLPQRGYPEGTTYEDTGGASRFFYCPKADREERNRGLEHMAPTVRNITEGHGRGAVNTSKVADDGIRTNHPTANVHPTVKPVELMRWLCRMVTPKGGTVLDPFTGSGSTGVAAMREGFEFIGIEREAEYVEIARARIIGDAPLFNVEAEPQEWNAPLAGRIAAVAAEREVDPPNE